MITQTGERGFAHILVLLLLFAGIAGGVYLVQHPQILKSRADSGKAPTGKFTVTTLDTQAHGYATFQSHNQKIVSNQYGIFMTYIHSADYPDGPYNNINWRLARSTDGGRTFSTVYEATNATNPPPIETDPNGNIYLIHSNWATDSSATFLKFSPGNQFSDPVVRTSIPGGAAGKNAMILDWTRQRFYYSGWGANFYILDLNGQILKSEVLTIGGPKAVPQYPLLALDSNGDIYHAWTDNDRTKYMYRSIHFVRSKDGGYSWQKLDGTSLSLPIIADETSPADEVTLPDEHEVFTWLSTFFIKNNKLHMAYLAQAPLNRQHYVRYDLSTGKKDIDLYPTWKGENIALAGLDGHCTTDRDNAAAPIYCVFVNTENGVGRLGALYSDDNGQTWHDFAKDTTVSSVYQIGGVREFMSDGSIIGSFTYNQANGKPAAAFFKLGSAVPANLSISSNQIKAGGTMVVSWDSVFNSTPTDWVGLYKIDATDKSYSKDVDDLNTGGKWFYTSSCNRTTQTSKLSGSCNFIVPDFLPAGEYNLRLFSNNGYTKLASSIQFNVSSVTLKLSSVNIAAGNSITVSWADKANPDPKDWIGLFKESVNDQQWEKDSTNVAQWVFTSSCSKEVGEPKTSGTCTLTIPANLNPGSYEFRFFAKNGYNKIASSEKITVTSATAAQTSSPTPNPTIPPLAVTPSPTVISSVAPSPTPSTQPSPTQLNNNLIANPNFDQGFNTVNDIYGVGQLAKGWWNWSVAQASPKLSASNGQKILASVAGDGIGQHPTLEVGKTYQFKVNLNVEQGEVLVEIGKAGMANDVQTIVGTGSREVILTYTPTQTNCTIAIYSSGGSATFTVTNASLTKI